MRAVFLLLVLANALFYAYAFVARERAPASGAGPELQINAEKVRIIRDTAPRSGAAPAAACLEWGVIAGTDIARADAALERLELPAGALQRVTVDAVGYWVHIPPLKGKAEVDRKMAELKKLGIADYSTVQDATLGRNAISLGVFSTEEAAEGRIAALKEKGVRSARVERRDGLVRHARFFVREPGTETVARFAELQQGFPGTQIKAGPCPPPRATPN